MQENKKFFSKELIIFDLDGTLTASKSNLKPDMAQLLEKLLEKKKVAVIGGGSYKQFRNQFVDYLNIREGLLSNLFLFPTCSTAFYRYKDGEWKKIYEEALSKEEKEKIFNAFEKTFSELNYKHPEKTYGKIIEDRISQITFSALGQKAPLEEKQKWDPNAEKRKRIKSVLEKYIPEFEIRIGGTTSIDVTKKGIDKAYGIRQIEKHLGIPKNKMLFIGDALFPGGNDWPVKETGVECIAIKGVEECKKVIKKIIEES